MNADAEMPTPRFLIGVPLLQKKKKYLEVKKIVLKEGNKNITNDDELCEVFNRYRILSNCIAAG